MLAIGQLSEEAQASCNNSIKKCREDFARKCSGTNLEDSLLRPAKAIALLHAPSVPVKNVNRDEPSSSDTDDGDFYDVLDDE